MEAAPVKRGLVGVEEALEVPVGELEPLLEGAVLPLLEGATPVLDAVERVLEAAPVLVEPETEVVEPPLEAVVVVEPQEVGEPWKASIPFWMASVIPAESWAAMLWRAVGTLEVMASERAPAAVFCCWRSARTLAPWQAAFS